MTFRCVYLTEAEKDYWIKYFTEMCPRLSGYVKRRGVWDAYTINEEQTIFIKNYSTDREEPFIKSFLYYWQGHLFRLIMRQVWGEEQVECWKVLSLANHFDTNIYQGVFLNQEVIDQQEKIFKDLQEVMVVYGEAGLPVMKGYEYRSDPIPTIRIDVDGRSY